MDFEVMLGILVISMIFVYLIKNRTKESLHMVQLEGYVPEDYLKWLNNNKSRAYSIKKENLPIKKPLVMTDRAKRLFYVNYGLTVFLIVSLSLILVNLISVWGSPLVVTLIILALFMAWAYYLQPIIIWLATLIMKPVENSINMGFYKSAQNKIRQREDLTDRKSVV